MIFDSGGVFVSAITVDRFYLQLLHVLQQDGQATNQVIGEKVHLSASQVSRRILRLQQAGVIDHYCALLDPGAVGLDVMAFTMVTLDRQNSTVGKRFEAEVEHLPHILECYTLAGEADYMLRIVAADLGAFAQFMTQKLLRMPGVANVKSIITLQKIKQTSVLPLDHILHPTESRQRVQFASAGQDKRV